MIVPGQKETSSSYKDVLNYLITNYNETRELVEKHLKGNPPIKVRMYLESCEGLPHEYVAYGAKMYESRYNFAQNLLLQKGTKNSEDRLPEEL